MFVAERNATPGNRVETAADESSPAPMSDGSKPQKRIHGRG